MKESFERGALWMIFSASCLSIAILFIKILSFQFDYLFFLFLRFCLPFLIVLLLILIFWKWSQISTKGILFQFLRAFCVLVSQYALVYYMMENSLLNATVLLNTGPLFIPLLDRIFFRHPIGKSTLVGMIIAFFGVILVLQPGKELWSPMSLIGLLAALGQAVSQLLYGIRSRQDSPASNIFYLFFFTTLISFAIFLIKGSVATSQILTHSLWIIGIFFFLMALATLGNQYFRALAYRCSRPSRLAPFLFFSILVSGIFDWLVFKTPPNILSILGGCLIVLGGILKILLRAHILKKRRQDRSQS